MSRLTVRLPDDVHEMLKYESLRQQRSINNMLTEAVRFYIDLAPKEELQQIRQAIVSARARGRRSLSESLRLAKKVAELDDAEGLGPIKVSRATPER